MIKRAVLYARVSGDDRNKEGRNLAGQIEMGRAHSQERRYEVTAELSEDDRGASGASWELPQLSKILDMARNHEFDVLVVRELDRLSRSLAKQLIVEEELKRAGVRIEYVLGEYPDTPEGHFMKNVHASVAELDREKIRERLVRGRQLKVKAGSVLVQKRPPYGYQVVERDRKCVLEINEEEAQVVRMVFDWYTVGNGVQGPMSVRRIQHKLTEMKMPTLNDVRNPGVKKREYGEWSQSTVYRMLANETYAGTWHFGKSAKKGELIAVPVPPIVSRELWARAQSKRVENKANAVTGNLKYQYLVGRRVRCGKCGVKVQADTARRGRSEAYLYYRCPATGPANMDYSHTCDLPGFRVVQVDATVWEWIRNLITDPAALEKGLNSLRAHEDESRAPIRARLQYLDGQVADKQAQADRLLDLYQSGGLAKEKYMERTGKLQAAIVEHNTEGATLTQQLEAQTLSEQEIQDLQAFTESICGRLPEKEKDFEFRRFVIDTLKVWAMLVVEDGQKFVDVTCDLAPEKQRFPILSTSIPSPRRRRSRTDRDSLPRPA